jgi:hypothetical protein
VPVNHLTKKRSAPVEIPRFRPSPFCRSILPGMMRGSETMKYMLLIYVDEAKGAQAAKEQGVTQMTAPYIAYAEALQKAGVIRGGDRLQPASTATTVRVADGKTQVLNGPYAETKEQLGGYFMIDVPDLDTALSWAARCPGAAHGTVEVRPLWAMTA